MSVATAAYGIVVRDLSRAMRQKSRMLGGIARPFMWLLLVGSGYNAIARIDGAASYQAFVFPGVVVMAMFFGAMLTAISTVYDREFGILRLMLAGPSGIPAMLVGRIIAASAIGLLQGMAILIFIPFFISVSASQVLAAVLALMVGALASSSLGLAVAAPLRSVENFAGIINVVLFPLLFLSGALYPTSRMAPPLRVLALVNPVSYSVDLMRAALDLPAEFSATRSMLVLVGTTVAAFLLTMIVFDPEQRFRGKAAAR